MGKTVIRYGLIILLLLSTVYLLHKADLLPQLSNPFKSTPLLIDETPVLIKDIKNLAQIITISAYDEVVVDSSKAKHLPSYPGLRPVPDKIVLIAKGSVYAGINLAKLKAGDVFVKRDSVHLILPRAEILSTIVNPSDFETFEEVGKWDYNAVKLLKIKARQKIIIRALQNDILRKATRRATSVMENFLFSAGFKKVTISIR